MPAKKAFTGGEALLAFLDREQIRTVRRLLEQVVPLASPVLLTGEPGSGREVGAR